MIRYTKYTSLLAATFSIVGLFSGARASAEQQLPTISIGQQIPDFRLTDTSGVSRRLSDYRDSIVVIVFLGTECPLAKLYGPRLQSLSDRFHAENVVMLGVNSNRQDSMEELREYERKHSISFPLLKDPKNQVADLLGAIRTPEVFLLDRQHRLQYWGRIDDQFGVGYAREQPTRKDLGPAIESLLAGEAIEQAIQPSVGCYIGRVRDAQGEPEVTYSQHVSRLLQKHCVECHREGDIAPFALTEYDEVAGWADTLVEVVRDGRMPPWHADPRFGSFRNERGMSETEKQLLEDWVLAGTPAGDPENLPTPLEFTTGWRLPETPDLVVPISDVPFKVPADETVEYQYFIVDPGFTEDRWIKAAEVIPGNRSVVHHSIVFVRPPGEVQQQDLGWLSAYVPGQSALTLPANQAILVPAGSKFVFQMHYTPTGRPESDVTRLGLVFADEEQVTERVLTLIALNRKFQIPPHASNHEVTAWLSRFPANSKLLAMAPHMHLRGKSFRFTLHPPVGNRDNAGDSTPHTLLNVPRYDFNWQHSYELSKPLPLEPGCRIECTAVFDNSAGNRVNPDPTRVVSWGDQTWQEMVVAYFVIAVPREQSLRVAREDSAKRQRRQQAEKSADRLLRRFDEDDDSRLSRDEVPNAFAIFGFRQIDFNEDGWIDRDEAVRHAWNEGG